MGEYNDANNSCSIASNSNDNDITQMLTPTCKNDNYYSIKEYQ